MITSIPNTILFDDAKRQIKQNIIKRLKIVLDQKYDNITELREDAVRLQKYAESHAALETLYNAFVMLDDEDEFETFKSQYFNKENSEALDSYGVEKGCLRDLEFYLLLRSDELDNSITVKPILARVNNNSVEVKVKVCVGGYCYESSEVVEDCSNALSSKPKSSDDVKDGKNGYSQ